MDSIIQFNEYLIFCQNIKKSEADAALTFFESFFVSPPAKLVGQEDKKGFRVWGKAPILDSNRYATGYSFSFFTHIEIKTDNHVQPHFVGNFNVLYLIFRICGVSVD